MYNVKKSIKLGIAPIGWRNDDIPEIGKENTYKQILSDAALTGFSGTEVGGCYPQDPAELNKELMLRGLEIPGQWFSSFIIRDGIASAMNAFEQHCAYLQAIHAYVAVVSEQTYSIQGIIDKCVYTEKPNFSDSEWQLLCEGLNALGKIANAHGLKLAFHHHMGTVVQSLAEVDRMMENTDPEYVSLLFDTGHFTYCGEDPLEVVKKYVHRIKHVHLKDIRPEVVEQVKKENMSFLAGVRAGAFTIPGDGCINYDPIFKVLEEAGYEGYMVVEAEQDPAKANPLEYAIRARKFIAEKTGL